MRRAVVVVGVVGVVAGSLRGCFDGDGGLTGATCAPPMRGTFGGEDALALAVGTICGAGLPSRRGRSRAAADGVLPIGAVCGCVLVVHAKCDRGGVAAGACSPVYGAVAVRGILDGGGVVARGVVGVVEVVGVAVAVVCTTLDGGAAAA